MEHKVGVFRITATIFCAFLFVLPLWWIGISGIRPEGDIFRFLSPLSWQTFIPTVTTGENLISLWNSSFRQAIFNSLFVTFMTIVFGLLVCSAAAFVLAVIDFPGRNILFGLVVVTFLIPFDAIAVPLLGIMRGLELQNSYLALILPGIGNGIAIFLLRQFFLGIPKELLEAAQVDGLGWISIFFYIYLPLSVPALISAGLILFVFQWQAYLWPLLIAPSPDYKVAAVAIAQLSDPYLVKNGLTFAAALVLSIIPIGVVIGFQRYFVMSVANTGSKQ
jgi:putative chitobiose transport system permease protein